MKKLFCLVLMLVGLGLPVRADTVVNPGGQGPTGMTYAKSTIPASSTKVSLTAPSASICIVNGSTTATLYWSPVTPATTSSYPILPGNSWCYWGTPLSAFWVIGSAAGDPYGYEAH